MLTTSLNLVDTLPTFKYALRNPSNKRAYRERNGLDTKEYPQVTSLTADSLVNPAEHDPWSLVLLCGI